MEPIGRSYTVKAPTRDLAPNAARVLVKDPRAIVLHVEMVEPGLYEVVIQEGVCQGDVS